MDGEICWEDTIDSGRAATGAQPEALAMLCIGLKPHALACKPLELGTARGGKQKKVREGEERLGEESEGRKRGLLRSEPREGLGRIVGSRLEQR